MAVRAMEMAGHNLQNICVQIQRERPASATVSSPGTDSLLSSDIFINPGIPRDQRKQVHGLELLAEALEIDQYNDQRRQGADTNDMSGINHLATQKPARGQQSARVSENNAIAEQDALAQLEKDLSQQQTVLDQRRSELVQQRHELTQRKITQLNEFLRNAVAQQTSALAQQKDALAQQTRTIPLKNTFGQQRSALAQQTDALAQLSVRNNLKQAIIQRRSEEGKGAIDLSQEKREDEIEQLSHGDLELRRKRRLQNNISAKRCRQKKKQYLGMVMAEMKFEQKRRKMLERQLTTLTAKKETLARLWKSSLTETANEASIRLVHSLFSTADDPYTTGSNSSVSRDTKCHTITDAIHRSDDKEAAIVIDDESDDDSLNSDEMPVTTPRFNEIEGYETKSEVKDIVMEHPVQQIKTEHGWGSGYGVKAMPTDNVVTKQFENITDKYWTMILRAKHPSVESAVKKELLMDPDEDQRLAMTSGAKHQITEKIIKKEQDENDACWTVGLGAKHLKIEQPCDVEDVVKTELIDDNDKLCAGHPEAGNMNIERTSAAERDRAAFVLSDVGGGDGVSSMIIVMDQVGGVEVMDDEYEEMTEEDTCDDVKAFERRENADMTEETKHSMASYKAAFGNMFEDSSSSMDVSEEIAPRGKFVNLSEDSGDTMDTFKEVCKDMVVTDDDSDSEIEDRPLIIDLTE